MGKQVFINLPVDDLAKSTVFYEKLGFTKNPMFSDSNASSMVWSDEVAVMLLTKDFFKRFVPDKEVADSRAVSEVLLCLTMDSREDVDATANAAIENGGKLHENEVAQEFGDAMYGRDVSDLDGHIWELLYMDMSKYPAAAKPDSE